MGIEDPTHTVTITKGSIGNKTYTANWESLAAFGYSEGYAADGSEEKPYVISNAEGWELFRQALGDKDTWDNLNGKFLKLSTDIGTEDSPITSILSNNFCGTFDGQGHTLTVSFDTSEEYTALFSSVSGTTTIRNLDVAGTIKTSAPHAAGLIGQSKGTTTIENCNVSVTIDSSVDDEGLHGGFVAEQSGGTTLTIEGCVFSGKILGKNTEAWSGFVADKPNKPRKGTTEITDSLFAPAEITSNPENSAPFFSGSGNNDITNCYYTFTFDSDGYLDQGKQGFTVSADEGITVALADESTKGLTHDGTIYAGEDETLTLTITDEIVPSSGYLMSGYTSDIGTLRSTESAVKYTLRMPSNPSNVKISAVFVPEIYTITYDLADGELPEGQTNPAAYTVESSDLTLKKPERTGYSFAGWTGTGLTSASTDVTIPAGSTGSRDYTATWTAHTYTVTFNANAGTGDAMEAQGFTYDADSTALNANTYTREGYTFVGWNTQADGNGTDYSDGQEVQNLTSDADGKITLYAKWTVITYTITYDLADGNLADGETNPTSYTIESDAITLTNPTRDGYTFTGWTGTELDGATLTVTIPAGSTGDRSYSEAWSKRWTPTNENTPEFAYHSLILSGQIGVLFHVYVPEGASSKDYCMYFDVSGDKSQNTQPVYPFEEFTEYGNTFFGFKCYINSVQMADEIHAVLNYGEGQILTHMYTAKSYLDALISNSSQPDDVIELGKAIKDYGSYVQLILAEENGWEIGKKHAAMDSEYNYDDSDFTDTETATKLEAITCTVPEGSGIKDIGFALVLDSETAIELYLTTKDGYTGYVEAYVDGGTTNIAEKKGSEYVVNIGNISAHKLGEKYTVKVVTQYDNMDAVSFEVKLSALSYVQAAIQQEDQAMKRAVTSLYRYWKATTTYRKNRPGIYGGGK